MKDIRIQILPDNTDESTVKLKSTITYQFDMSKLLLERMMKSPEIKELVYQDYKNGIINYFNEDNVIEEKLKEEFEKGLKDLTHFNDIHIAKK